MSVQTGPVKEMVDLAVDVEGGPVHGIGQASRMMKAALTQVSVFFFVVTSLPLLVHEMMSGGM